MAYARDRCWRGVRSSSEARRSARMALGESFAGQLDSILHVGDEAALERALLDCWSSLWSERVLFYRSARRLEARGMGVVVQQQVDAVAAGVLFTTTTDGPCSSSSRRALADALVSGRDRPGSYRRSIARRVRQSISPMPWTRRARRSSSARRLFQRCSCRRGARARVRWPAGRRVGARERWRR